MSAIFLKEKTFLCHLTCFQNRATWSWLAPTLNLPLSFHQRNMWLILSATKLAFETGHSPNNNCNKTACLLPPGCSTKNQCRNGCCRFKHSFATVVLSRKKLHHLVLTATWFFLPILSKLRKAPLVTRSSVCKKRGKVTLEFPLTSSWMLVTWS